MLCIQRNEIKNRLTFSKSNTAKGLSLGDNAKLATCWCAGYIVIDKTFVNEVELRKFNISISYKNIYIMILYIYVLLSRGSLLS